MKKLMKDIFLKLVFNAPTKLYELHNGLLFLSEMMKIEKVEKLLANLHEHVIFMKNLKQALNHGLILRKVQRVIKFNQRDWLKPYIKMNTELRQEIKK